MDEPHKIDSFKFDYSKFHPLMHSPFSRECRQYYGGPRRHVELAWEYQWRSWLASKTLCKLGRHEVTQDWDGDRVVRTVCWHCREVIGD